MTKRTPDPNPAAGLAATGGLASARTWPALRTVSAAAAKSLIWAEGPGKQG
jgi:hypothetical protein